MKKLEYLHIIDVANNDYLYDLDNDSSISSITDHGEFFVISCRESEKVFIKHNVICFDARVLVERVVKLN